MWKLPIWIKDKILLSPGGFPASSLYIAKGINDDKQDLYIPIIDFVYKFISYPKINYHIAGLENNIIDLFIIISKIDSYIYGNQRHLLISDFVKTDMEYLFIVCKRMYDILQHIIMILWESIKTFDGQEKVNLPERFRNIVINNNKRRSIDEIVSYYHLPKDIAQFYINQIDFYERLKKIRDDIVHREKTFDTFFILDDGIGISNSDKLFDVFEILNTNDHKQNGIYSIRPLINYVITTTLKSCCDFCNCIAQIIILPKPIIIDFNVYLRTPSIENYTKMYNELQKTSWWSK
jgi:hypothetical protein